MNNIDTVAEAIGVSRDVFISAVRAALKEPRCIPSFDVPEQEDARTLVDTRLNWNSPKTEWKWMSAKEFLQRAGVKDPTNSACKAASFLIRQRGSTASKRSSVARLIHVPPFIVLK